MDNEHSKPVSFEKQVWVLIGAIGFFIVCAIIPLVSILETNDFWVILGTGRRKIPAGLLLIGAVVMTAGGIWALIKVVRKENNKKIE